MRWYNHLVKQNHPNKVSLLESEEVEGKIVVCRQLQYRSFRTFPRVGVLYNHLKGLPEDQRVYYEIITCEKSKLYFDVDIKTEDIKYEGIPLSEHNVSLVEVVLKAVGQEVMESIIKAILGTAKEFNLELVPDDIMVFSSCSRTKESYHIVIPKYYVLTPAHNRVIFDSVSSRVPKKFNRFLDSAVYKRNQQFRIVWCQKYKSNRIKTHMLNWKFGSVEGRFLTSKLTGEELQKYILDQSLVSRVLDCELVHVNIPEEKKWDLDDDVEEGLINEIASLIPDKDKFVFRRVNGRIVEFNRIGSSRCIICKKKEPHDNENIFCILHPNKRVSYFCRRNQKEGFDLGLLPSASREQSERRREERRKENIRILKEKEFNKEKKNFYRQVESYQFMK